MEDERYLQEREYEEFLLRKDESDSKRKWQVLGGAALILGGVLLIVSLPDIKRYIRISRM